MTQLEELIQESLKKRDQFDPNSVVADFNDKQDNLDIAYGLGDVAQKDEIGNYAWWPGFIELAKPEQVVELGSAMGVAAICMLSSAYQNFHLYGVTLEEHGLEFCYIRKDKYTNFTPMVGDYMDLSIWPKEVDLRKTDIWYIDGLHEEEHVKAQVALYKPFYKPGTLIVFDDIYQNPGMARMWHSLEDIVDIEEKIDLTPYGLHYTGYGMIKIK